MSRLALLLAVPLVFTSARGQNFSPANVRTFPDQPLPVTVRHATIQNFQFTSEIDAQTTSVKGLKTDSIEYELFITNGDRVVAGEGWTTTEPVGSFHKETRMHLSAGDDAFLVVRSVTVAGRKYSLGMQDIAANLKSILRGEQPKASAVQIALKAAPHKTNAAFDTNVTVGYCSQALSAAQGACQNGLHSFSCDDAKQNYSFTCN